MRFGEFATAVLAAAALALPGAAGAATFSGSYTVSAHGSDPGLVVGIDPAPGSFATPDLAVGGSASFDLFAIWTDEADVGAGEDTAAKPISVSFAFTTPFLGGGTAEGSSYGERVLGGLFQNGRVTWNGPLTLAFGQGGTGQVTLALADAVFNSGLFGLNEGWKHGATVGATLTYDVAPVPLPATLPLLLGGIGLAGAAARRRRAPAAA